jgi:hypothetical protein
VSKRKKKQKHFAPKPNPALKLRSHENNGNKNEVLDLNPCLTSTPKGVRYKEKYQTFPFLSPIPHSVDKEHGTKATDEIIKEENNSYQSPLPLSEPHVHTFNVTRNILPDMCQVDPSRKTSNTLSVPSVVDGKTSNSLCTFSVRKFESLDVAAGAKIADSVIVIDVSSQLQSCKADESIVSTIFINGSFLSSPVHQCKNVNLRRQESRDSKHMEGALYKSDDSCVEDFLGFSDVAPAQNLCETNGKDSIVLSNSCPIRDSNQFSVINEGTEKCEVNGNLSTSKSRNMSLILFDSWDSVNGRKVEVTPESIPKGKVCNQNQVSKSEMLTSHSEKLLYTDHAGVHCAQDSAVQGSEEGPWHTNDSASHPAQESSVLSRDTGLLCSNFSKSLCLQESSADAYESHINNQDCSVQDSTIYNTDKGELLCNSISKNDILPESSVLNSGTGKSHADPRSFLS